MEEGKANYENFQLHLSTIFTEVRLKKYIELRSIDACEWDCHCAGPAFFIGLLYGNLNETFEIIKNWNKEDILKAYTTSYKDGLKTIINNKDLLFWSKELLNISKRGLENRSFVTTKNNDERIYLKNIENILSKNLTKAEQVLADIQK
jgi:glutamate--cysteine ligase